MRLAASIESLQQGFRQEELTLGLAIFSSRIYTADPARPWVEAIAMEGNRIAAAGSNEEVRKICGRDTEVFDLPGRLVTPGFVDAHVHFVNFGLTSQRVDLRNLSSLSACRERIRQAAALHRPGKWIVGRGWDPGRWVERRDPALLDIDDLAPHNPIMMVHASGHTVWVNSLALALSGISRKTPDPPGGRIERDPASGDLTGLIREARFLIENQIPHPTPQELREAALAAQQEALRFGITGVHSCETLRHWEVLARLQEERKLKLRVYHLLPPEDLDEAAFRQIRPGEEDGRLWFGHVKLLADGSLGSGTALLHEPYHDDPSHRGIARLSPAELRERIELSYRSGWDVAVHAIGDRALSNVLEAVAAARQGYPGPRRDRVEHAQLFRPQDLGRFRDLGLAATVQPTFIPTAWPMAERRLGPGRCRYAYACRSFLQAGIPLQLSTDAPVATINPLPGLRAAVTRQTPEGDPPGGWFPGERLTLEESIKGYTAIPAWTSRKENDLGTLARNKRADLTVFNQDLFGLPPDRWSSVEIEMTIVNGEIVYPSGKETGEPLSGGTVGSK
jgi:predicted amidohydrolase YtcJ